MERDFRSRTEALTAAEHDKAETRARDLAASIRKNLHFISGVPGVVAHDEEVRAALTRLAHDPGQSAGSPEQRAQRWSGDARLQELNHQLDGICERLGVDILFVTDSTGSVLAASDVGRAGPRIGAQVGHREYFRATRDERPGFQYAIGKVTGIPGLYFASPVVVDGRFSGTVVVKVHMPNLSFLLDQSDAFLSDTNGVIVMAHDKRMEMQAMPDATLAGLSAAAKEERYHRQNFLPLALRPWADAAATPAARALVAVGDSDVPSVIAEQDLAEYGMRVHVIDAIPAIPEMHSDRTWFAVLLGTSGSLLICLACALAAYIRSLGTSRARLWRQAHFDALTGLPNRELFRQHLNEALTLAQRSGRPLALIIGDIDRFKAVNDTHGHSAGDELLRHAGDRLARSVGVSGIAARLGGDEFAVLVHGVDDATGALEIARRMIAALDVPVTIGGVVLHPAMSLGVAVYPEDAADAKGLLRQADEAMYVAKRQGGNQAARCVA